MSRKRKPLGEYEVGYGRPPAQTRFKPGQSGNPKGRPKGALDIATIVRNALAEKVVAIEGGRQRKGTKLEFLVTSHLNKAIKGDARSFGLIVGMAHRTGLINSVAPDEAAAPEIPLSEAEEALVARFFAQVPESSDDEEDGE